MTTGCEISHNRTIQYMSNLNTQSNIILQLNPQQINCIADLEYTKTREPYKHYELL
jgi:hypothetical protein